MGPNILSNYGEAVAMLLFTIGFTNLLQQQIRKPDPRRACAYGHSGFGFGQRPHAFADGEALSALSYPEP